MDIDVNDREDFRGTLGARDSMGGAPDASCGFEEGGKTVTTATAFRNGRLDRTRAINQIVARIAALPPDSPVLALIAARL